MLGDLSFSDYSFADNASMTIPDNGPAHLPRLARGEAD